MSATVTPRRKAAILIRPRSSGVTSMVRRAVNAVTSVARGGGVGGLDPLIGVGGSRGKAAAG